MKLIPTDRPLYLILDDETVWPLPGPAMSDLSRSIRYAADHNPTVDAPRTLCATSIIAAYRELVNATRARREQVVRALRAHRQPDDDP